MRVAGVLGLLFAIVFGLFAVVELSSINDSLTVTGSLSTFSNSLPTILLFVVVGIGVLAVAGAARLFFWR